MGQVSSTIIQLGHYNVETEVTWTVHAPADHTTNRLPTNAQRLAQHRVLQPLAAAPSGWSQSVEQHWQPAWDYPTLGGLISQYICKGLADTAWSAI
jgi:hypothetical protein